MESPKSESINLFLFFALFVVVVVEFLVYLFIDLAMSGLKLQHVGSLVAACELSVAA